MIQNVVHICDSIIENAQRLANKDKSRCFGYQLDASDKEQVRKMVKKSEISVSLLPAMFHDIVAECCLEEKRHLTTASYLSEHMKKMDQQCQQDQLIFITECGLDPGLDHIMAMILKDYAQANTCTILEYQSWCGGLISPENCDNPIGYKFSWSPLGALKALTNPAVFLSNDKEVQVASLDLLFSTQNMSDINMALNLEGYPNRDSIKYKSLYDLSSCHTVLRGTLRYSNFAFIMRSLIHLGLFDQLTLISSLPQQCNNWSSVILAQNPNPSPFTIFDNQQFTQLYQQANSKSVDAGCLQIILQKVFSHPHYQQFNKQQLMHFASNLVKSLMFFGFLDYSSIYKFDVSQSVFQNLVNHLSEKLKLYPDEKDCVILYTVIKYKDQYENVKNKALSLIKFGDQHNSAMAQTVSIPLAILTQAILDKKITKYGVNIPIDKQIYRPIMEQLDTNGIKFKETNF